MPRPPSPALVGIGELRRCTPLLPAEAQADPLRTGLERPAEQPQTPAPRNGGRGAGAEPPSTAPEHSAAVVKLLSQARLQYRYGEYQYAVRTAERGLRIDRSQSEWYLILAESYLKLGSSGNAQQFARQGLRYSSPVGQSYQRLKQISDGQF